VAGRQVSPAVVLAEQFWRTVQAFNRFTGPIGFYNPLRPLTMPPANIFFVVGLIAVLARCWRPAPALLALLFVAPLVAGGVLSETTPNSARLILLAPVVSLLAAVGLERAGVALRAARGWGASAVLLWILVVGVTAWADLHFFFVTSPPRREYDDNSALASDLGRYVQSLGPEARRYRVYLFGTPFLAYDGFRSLTFLTDGLPGQDVPPERLDPAEYVDRGRGAVFAVPRYRAAQLERLSQTYPQAARHVFPGPATDRAGSQAPLLTVLRVTPEEVAARTAAPRQGLQPE
jgi:hypothetical protein